MNIIRCPTYSHSRHYNNTALSDMIITFADKQIVGHKIVLSAKSDWFAELCNGKV